MAKTQTGWLLGRREGFFGFRVNAVRRVLLSESEEVIATTGNLCG